MDNKFKGWFNNEFAEKLLVCCAVANIAKTVDVNFFSCSSSSKSNTYNALKMMGEDVCKGVVAHVYIAWTDTLTTRGARTSRKGVAGGSVSGCA